MPTAILTTADSCTTGPYRARPAEASTTSENRRERLHEALCFLFLRSRAFGQHFFENVTGAIGVTHVHVRPGEVQLGAHCAHGDRLEVRQRELLRGEPLRGS